MLKKVKQILQTDLVPVFKKEFHVFPKLTSFEVQKARKALKVNFVLPKLAKKKQIRPIFTVALLLVVFACGAYLGNQADFKLISQSQANVLDTVKGWLWFLPQDKEKPATTGTFDLKESENPVYAPQTSQEEMIISAVEKAIPAVVTIVISKDVPTYEQYIERQKPFGDSSPFEIQVPKLRQNGTQEQEIGSGSGFIVSKDGLIVTNKHVVYDNTAYYTVFMSDGSSYKAKVLGTDPVQDLALIKIETENEVNKTGQVKQKTFPILTLGDSSKIKIGQTAIAIGNALGEFSNTVSVGVISGTGRTITAEGAGLSETLEDILQTDAAINKGNSGGPLLNLRGEVIGVNVAVAEEAQGIGFAVPINEAKIDIKQYQEQGEISRAFLGVRYVEVTPEVKEAEGLSVNVGVLISKGDNVNEPAVTPDSSAEKAGLKEGDVILEVSGEKITPNNTLSKIIRKYYPGQTITLKVLRDNAPLTLQVTLGNRTE